MDHERREKIEILAYHIWEKEGRPEGRSELHWQQALRESALHEGGAQSGKAAGRKRQASLPMRTSRAKDDVQVEGRARKEKRPQGRSKTSAGSRSPKRKK
jgi:hypothetical protein